MGKLQNLDLFRKEHYKIVKCNPNDVLNKFQKDFYRELPDGENSVKDKLDKKIHKNRKDSNENEISKDSDSTHNQDNLKEVHKKLDFYTPDKVQNDKDKVTEDQPKPDESAETELKHRFWSETEESTDFNKSVAFRKSSKTRGLVPPKPEPEPENDKEEGDNYGIDNKAYLKQPGKLACVYSFHSQQHHRGR